MVLVLVYALMMLSNNMSLHVQDQEEDVGEKVVEDLKRKATDAEEVSKEKEEKRMKEETEKRELDRVARQKAQIEKTQVGSFICGDGCNRFSQ